MKALLEIGIQEWLEPLDRTDEHYGNYRDSVLFGLFLKTKQSSPKRLAGFGHSLSHYGRAYVSSSEYFYTNIRERFPFMLPRMPNARVQTDISVLRMYDFLKSSAVDSDDASLITRYEKIIDCEELIDLHRMISTDRTYEEIEGLLIAAGLFSRTAFRSNTKWFEEMIDPILNFDDEGRGELSFHPDWGKDPAQAWCLTFDMKEFRTNIESAMYRQFDIIKSSGEASDFLRRECGLIMQKLPLANKTTKSSCPIEVEFQKPYVYDRRDLPGQ